VRTLLRMFALAVVGFFLPYRLMQPLSTLKVSQAGQS
jgi:hypothetical protein